MRFKFLGFPILFLPFLLFFQSCDQKFSPLQPNSTNSSSDDSQSGTGSPADPNPSPNPAPTPSPNPTPAPSPNPDPTPSPNPAPAPSPVPTPSPQGLGDLIPADHLSVWNPGILSDAQLGLPLNATTGLPMRTTVCATLSPLGAGKNDLTQIQNAINNCPAGQVVALSAGKFSISGTISLTKSVVLRGAGSTSGGTVIAMTASTGSVIQIGSSNDGACYSGSYGASYNLTATAAKESSAINLSPTDAAKFKAGDFAMIDQIDDSSISIGDKGQECPYFKRVGSINGPNRSVTQRVEIASVNATTGVLTLSSPVHWKYTAGGAYQAQIQKVTAQVVKWAGVEGIYLQGGKGGQYGGGSSYDGNYAGGIEISNAAYSWVKDVQTDATNIGMHLRLAGAYRVVVRDSYFHHSGHYDYGADSYGIVIGCASSENLIENNISRYMNKPIMFGVSGGGNVIGYNYADNAWSSDGGTSEVPIDNHCSFSHSDLMEGNFAPKMGATMTHGNAGYNVYFRNYASTQFAGPPVAGFPANTVLTQAIGSFVFGGGVNGAGGRGGDFGMSTVGNILGCTKTAGLGIPLNLGTATCNSTTFSTNSDNGVGIYIFGGGSPGNTDVVWQNGNYDTVNGPTRGTYWAPGTTTRTIPASLYLQRKPAWWPSGQTWPWVGPDLTPRVGTLPANQRAQGL